MKVYAIHCENVWTTDYNVVIFYSKRHAQKILKELNEPYSLWNKEKKYLYDNGFSNYENANYMDWVYRNPTPAKYRIEELNVVKNENRLSKRL